MKILLVQTSFLGDTILSTPVIAGIAKAFPDAGLWMMTTPQSEALVRNDPLLDGIITFDKRRTEAGISGIWKMARRLKSMQFDIAFVLHRSYRTALLMKLAGIPVRIGFRDAKLSFFYTEARPRNMAVHDVLRNLSLIKRELPLKCQETGLRLFPPGEHEISAHTRSILASAGHPIVLVPGSVWATKRWSWEGFRETAAYFSRNGHSVLLIGSPEDRELADRIALGTGAVNLAGQTRIPDVMAVIQKARLVICNDSMAMHVACAFQIPVVSVFCATTPALGYYPWRNRHILLEKTGLACKPCGKHGGNVCPEGTRACINGVTPEPVINAANRLLNR